jgi:hypothetical protein
VSDLASTGPLLARVAAAVGPALVEDATDESTRLLKSLGEAKTTTDLRKLGDAAAPEQAAVAAAAEALPTGKGKQVLAGYSAALAALSQLSEVTAENTSGWPATRAELARTFGEVAAGASAAGANVRVVLDGALSSSDAVVEAAARGITDWQARSEAAEKARTADTQALSEYAAAFRTTTKSYQQLREDLSEHLRRGEDLANNVTYGEDYAFLSTAIAERRYVRDQLISTDAPAAVEGAHAAVISAIDRSITAVQSAYDGLEQSQDCYYSEDCTYYLDTPGWQRFLSESRGSARRTARLERLGRRHGRGEGGIDQRVPPAKPDL